MTDEPPTHRTGDFDAEERQRLRIVHHRLRNASQAIESLLATEPMKGRWAPAAPTPEAVEGAKNEFEQAYQAVVTCHRQLGL
jgi:two-component sensor histidine kinase